MPRKLPTSNWTVTMRCVVEKKVLCVDCTEDQAMTKPWDYAEDEMETDQMDWEVLSVVKDE